MLLFYVLYSAFMCISAYLGEIDFSIISALKSQVSPRIAGHCIMIVKWVHNFFVFTSTCMSQLQSSINCRYFLCRLMYSNSTTWTHSLLLLLCGGMTDCCCCCLSLSDRSCLCLWIAAPCHAVGWATVHKHRCLCSVHKVEHNVILRLHLPYSGRGLDVVKSTW